jgi:phage/plasmid-associated DNA primase
MNQILAGLIGPYHAFLSGDVFTTDSSSQHNAKYAPLHEARIAVVNEPEKAARLNAGKIKEYSGDLKMTLERKHANPMQVDRSATIFFCMNREMQINDSSEAMFRRLKVIPFPQRFCEHSEWLLHKDIGKPIDPSIVDKVLAEAPAILNKLIKAYRDMLDDDAKGKPWMPLKWADDAKEAITAFDTVGEFIDEVLDVRTEVVDFCRKHSISMPLDSLVELYQAWYQDKYGAHTSKQFSKAPQTIRNDIRNALRRMDPSDRHTKRTERSRNAVHGVFIKTQIYQDRNNFWVKANCRKYDCLHSAYAEFTQKYHLKPPPMLLPDEPHSWDDGILRDQSEIKYWVDRLGLSTDCP